MTIKIKIKTATVVVVFLFILDSSPSGSMKIIIHFGFYLLLLPFRGWPDLEVISGSIATEKVA